MNKKKLTSAVKDIIWMARRYCNGRQTYAPDLFNDAYDYLRSELGDEIDSRKAFNMVDPKPFYDISIEHSQIHPYAKYGGNEESQTNKELKFRKFYLPIGEKPKKRKKI